MHIAEHYKTYDISTKLPFQKKVKKKGAYVCVRATYLYFSSKSKWYYLCILTEKFFYANPCGNYL